MSDYLELARRAKARRNGSGTRLASGAVVDTQSIRSPGILNPDPEGRKLRAAGFKPKERGGKTIWQRPDTGFWVSLEMALHLSEDKSTEGDLKA